MSDYRTEVKLDKEPKKLSETKHDFESDPASVLSSVYSSEESDRLDESNSVPCQACRQLELKSLELKKQREDLKRSLLLHLRHHHETKKSRKGSAVKNEIVQEPNQGDAPNVAKDQSHNLRLISERSLSDRLPSVKKQVSSPQPPEPLVKRLKGELAKSIGRKIDGCNLNFLNPDSGDNIS